jgi:general nucleoside transport system permease protein
MDSDILNVLGGLINASALGAVLRVTTPILLPSLGALISDRAGVINIGLEGIMLSAAFTGATVSGFTQNLLFGFLSGLFVGVLVSLLLAFFHLQLKGDLILGGIAINILGSAATVGVAYELFGSQSGTGTLTTLKMPEVNLSFLQSIEPLYQIIGNQNLMTWIAFLSVAAIWFLMYRMPFGKHLRAVGENPDAAASVGINVKRTRYLALALSGFLAAMGGIHLSMGYIEGFTRDMTAGRGYIALVAPALGNGTPGGTALAAVLFGVFASLDVRLASVVKAQLGVDIPSQLPSMIPYMATLVALVIYSARRQRARRLAGAAD